MSERDSLSFKEIVLLSILRLSPFSTMKVRYQADRKPTLVTTTDPGKREAVAYPDVDRAIIIPSGAGVNISVPGILDISKNDLVQVNDFRIKEGEGKSGGFGVRMNEGGFVRQEQGIVYAVGKTGLTIEWLGEDRQYDLAGKDRPKSFIPK